MNEMLTIIHDKLDKILSYLDGHQTSRTSELKELFTALAKAQSEMKEAGINRENPYYKDRYRDLSEAIRMTRPSLTKNGLAIIQQILPNNDGQMILHTILCHSSGQWIETQMRIVPTKTDVQTLGSHIMYLRRTSYESLVGVVSVFEDDDGECAMVPEREEYAKGTALKYSTKDKEYETITKEQLEELHYILVNHPDITEEILDRLRIQNLSDMPKNKFFQSTDRIREIIKVREGK